MGDFLYVLLMLGMAFALGVGVGARNHIYVDRIEWAYNVCEPNEGLVSTSGHGAICVNGAEFAHE